MARPSDAEYSRPDYRWTHYRKERLLLGLREGALSLEEAIQRYALSPEELAEWRRRYDEAGADGLRVIYRRRRSNGSKRDG